MDELVLKYNIIDLVTVNGRISKKLCEKIFVKGLADQAKEITQLKEQLEIAKSALLEIDQFVIYSKQDEVLPSEIAREALEQLNKE